MRCMTFAMVQPLRIASRAPAWLLLMDRNRVVDQRLHAVHPQMCLKRIVSPATHDEEVIYVGARFFRFGQEPHMRVVDGGAIRRSNLASPRSERVQPA